MRGYKPNNSDGAVLTRSTNDGIYIEPTILDAKGIETSLLRDEIFGLRSIEEAIAKANETEYGLAASVFTANG